MLKKTIAITTWVAFFGCGAEPINRGVEIEPIGEGEMFESEDWSMRLPLGLSPEDAVVPSDNPITDAKIELGRALYFDPRLSVDGTIACASCHIPAAGGTDNRAFSAGVGGALGGRSAPSMINRLFSAEQFWDGRAGSLEEQALGPIEAGVEMANDLESVTSTLSEMPAYITLFDQAFGSPDVTPERIGKAIATFERVVIAGDSPYDRYMAGDLYALSESEQRGMDLYFGKARCDLCHRGPNLTAEEYRNIGVGMDAESPDLGRFDVTGKEEDKGAFKTPSLRNVAMTAPYMHDGSEATLEDVVRYYERGGNANPWLDSDMEPFELTDEERKDLVAFMIALTGPILNAHAPRELPDPDHGLAQ